MNTESPSSNCPFCLDNQLLKGEIVAQSDHAYAVVPQGAADSYLIIPKQHAEMLTDLPDNWWQDFKAVLQQLPHLSDSYNLSLNYGAAAGQTVKHVHFWLIKRSEADKAAGRGLASLLDQANRE